MPNRADLMSHMKPMSFENDGVRPKTTIGVRTKRLFSANMSNEDIWGK